MINEKKRLYWLAVLAALFLLVIPTGLVFAKGITHIIIRGPGIDDELRIDDLSANLALMEIGFPRGSMLETPPDVSNMTGYQITIFMDIGEGPEEYMRVQYYPQTDGENDIFHQERVFGTVFSPDPEINREINAEWLTAHPSTAAAFREILASFDVTLVPAAALEVDKMPAQQEASAPAPPDKGMPAAGRPSLADTNPSAGRSTALFPLMLAAGFGALALIGALVLRRAARTA